MEKKIVPQYLEMPHDVLGFCVAVLHRQCVLYFHSSRVSSWKLWWIFSEQDVKCLLFFPSVDVRRHAVSLRKMGGKKPPCHTRSVSKIISRVWNWSYHMQLKPGPLGAGHVSQLVAPFVGCSAWANTITSALKLPTSVTFNTLKIYSTGGMVHGRRNTG